VSGPNSLSGLNSLPGRDVLSGRAKPTIFAAAGDVVVTTDQALAGWLAGGRSGDPASVQASDPASGRASVEILQVFPERSLLGRAVVVRVRRAGPVLLIGRRTIVSSPTYSPS